MYTRQLLALTLLATSLTLNAAIPKQYVITYKQQENSIASTLANILYKRGIEKEKALEISQKFASENEELFALMLNNLLNMSSLPKEKVLEQLSTMALQRKSVDFTSYASLIQLTQKLQAYALSEKQLHLLEQIAGKNQTLKQVFS
jgi:hypothetical protein